MMEESPYVVVVRQEFQNLRKSIADHESKLEQNINEILAKAPAPVPREPPRNDLHAEELRQLRFSARESSGKIKLLQYQLAKAKSPSQSQEGPLLPKSNEDCAKLLHFHKLHSVLQELKSHSSVYAPTNAPVNASPAVQSAQSPAKNEDTTTISLLQFSPASFATTVANNDNSSFLSTAFQRKVFNSATTTHPSPVSIASLRDENGDHNKQNRTSSTFTFDLDESLVPPSQMKMLFRAFHNVSNNNSMNDSCLTMKSVKSRIVEEVPTPAQSCRLTARSTPMTNSNKKKFIATTDSGCKSLRSFYSRATELDSFLVDDNSSVEDLELSCHTLNTTFDLCHNLETARWTTNRVNNEGQHRVSFQDMSRDSHSSSTAWARPLRQSYSRATL